MSRRSVAIWSSVGLVVAAVVAVALFGIVRPPDVPDLGQSGSELPAAVAGLRDTGDRQCVVIVAPDGGERTGHCAERFAELVLDDDGRLLLVSYEGSGEVATVLDPVTGEPRGREVRDRTGPPRPGGGDPEPTVAIDSVDGQLEISLLTDEGERLLARLDDPRGYDLRQGSWSPDQRWLLLLDSEDRVLAVSRDGMIVKVGEQIRRPLWVPR